MNDLENKYRNNKLTSAELSEWKEKVNSMNDNQLEESMRQHWMNDDIDVSGVDTARMDRIKKKIDRKTAQKPQLYPLLLKVAQIAAVTLLPVFILMTLYLYRENNRLSSEEMVVTTGKGERASITLPDGTRVMLNYNSALSYTPKIYNKEERKISFDGEGYFRVSKNKECPFVIDAKGLQIKVLGTAFNLSARKNNKTAELTLEEGSVLFTSTQTGKNVMPEPGQKAILDYATGKITVSKEENIQVATAWKEGELVFRKERLPAVIQCMEDTYGVKITLHCEDCSSDLFTGTLPASDINEALEILEKTYHLTSTVKGKEIQMTKDK